MSSSESIHSEDSSAISTATTLDEASLPCYPQPAHLRTNPPQPTRRFDLEHREDSYTRDNKFADASKEAMSLTDFLKAAAKDAEMSTALSARVNTNLSTETLTDAKDKHNNKKRHRVCGGGHFDFSFCGLCTTNSNNATVSESSTGGGSRRAVIGSSGEGVGESCVLM